LGKDKKLVIWMNGKKTRLKRDDHILDEKYSIKEFNEEHAAAIEDSDIPELTRQDGDNHNKAIYYTRKSRFRAFKPFLIASISAVIIGSLLGFFMLNMFVDINADINQRDGSPLSAAANDEDETNGAGGEGNDAASGDGAASPVTFEAVDAFVLQAGKFGEKANADEMAATVQQAGFAAMVWEKEGFFHVLSGIAASKQQGTQLANTFADEGLEVFVKEWQTEADERELPDKENEWLQKYEQQWNDSLASVTDGNQLSKNAWAEIVDTIPENTEYITDFTETLKEQHEQIGQGGKWQDQVILLSLWEQYNQMAVQ